MADGPLRDVRILDLTHVWAGPLAVRILSDLGADVVKVEAPASRGPLNWPDPPLGGWLSGDPAGEPWNRNAAFVKLARNRKSLCIDLKSPAGRDAFLALAATVDVVVENFSAHTMAALSLDWPHLQAANPRLVYLTMPGFGSSGPYRERVAFGPVVEPMAGLTAVMGYGPAEPRCTAMALMDPIAALSAASAVLTALEERSRTGQGARVELSLHEAGVVYSGPWLVERQLGGQPAPIGNRHPAMAPHGIYRCAGEDAWVAIACRDDEQWQALCDVIGEGLAPDLPLAGRRDRHDAIDAVIGGWTAARTPDAATEALAQAGVPAGSVNAVPDMLKDPQIRARGFFVPLEEGMPVPGNPLKMAGSSPSDWTPCPRLGADNAAVLSEWLGYDDARIRALERSGVLADRPPA